MSTFEYTWVYSSIFTFVNIYFKCPTSLTSLLTHSTKSIVSASGPIAQHFPKALVIFCLSCPQGYSPQTVSFLRERLCLPCLIHCTMFPIPKHSDLLMKDVKYTLNWILKQFFMEPSNSYWFSPFNKYSFIFKVITSTIFWGKFVYLCLMSSAG